MKTTARTPRVVVNCGEALAAYTNPTSIAPAKDKTMIAKAIDLFLLAPWS
jgi:hypothetical protein